MYDGTPVVIVGNGPVGQTTALLLARWGIRSVVLDRRPGRTAIGSRSLCQQRHTLDIWDSIGVGATLAEEGVTWSTARTFHGDRELFSLTFSEPGGSPFPPWVNVGQSRVEELLDEQLAACDLVEVCWRAEVTGLAQDGDEVEVSIAGAEPMRAAYVVLAAGGHCDTLRADLEVAFEGREFDDRFLICDIRADLGGWERERRFFFDPAWNPGRQVLIHPCPDSTYRIDWQVAPDFDLLAEEADGRLDRRIRAIVGDASYEVVWRSVYRFASRLADRFVAGRVLLAGDAAHLVAPFGARGLNAGVADAENAAWKLAFVLHGWAAPALLDSYGAERRAAGVENLGITTATMDFLVPQTPAAAEHRRTVLAAAAEDPAARAQVDSGRLAEPFWYPESPLTTPDPTRPVAARPPRGQAPPPGVGVLLPDLTSGGVRLRETARRGFTLLHRTGDPVPAASHCIEVGLDEATAEQLGTRPGEIWVVRPDAHVAAIVGADRVGEALDRALGRR